MIKKELMKSVKLMQHEALLRRLPETHPQYKEIQKGYRRYSSGHKGELSLSHAIRRGILYKEGIVLHDLRLKHGEDDFFQIDTLLMTPQFFLILDSKYISGELYFDEKFHQLSRNYNGSKESFLDPILQVENHTEKLKEWLKVNGFPSVPIESLVVITHPKATISASPNYHKAEKMVINLQGLTLKEQHFIRCHPKKIIAEKDLKKIAKTLYKQNIPLHTDILPIFLLGKDDIRKGIFCPECSLTPMLRIYGRWSCSYCGATSKKAHLNALIDYTLLLGSTINSPQFREFMNFSSISISSKQLKQLNLKELGSGKSRKYLLSLYDLIQKSERASEVYFSSKEIF